MIDYKQLFKYSFYLYFEWKPNKMVAEDEITEWIILVGSSKINLIFTSKYTWVYLYNVYLKYLYIFLYI